MYILEDVDPGDKFKVNPPTQKDAEGHEIDLGELRVEMSSTDEDVVSVTQDPDDQFAGSIAIGGPGAATVTVRTFKVDDDEQPLTSFAASFEITTGPPTETTGGDLKFERIQEAPTAPDTSSGGGSDSGGFGDTGTGFGDTTSSGESTFPTNEGTPPTEPTPPTGTGLGTNPDGAPVNPSGEGNSDGTPVTPPVGLNPDGDLANPPVTPATPADGTLPDGTAPVGTPVTAPDGTQTVTNPDGTVTVTPP